MPGPFSTEELIPTGAVPAVTQQGESIASCLERAERGPEGWRVASREGGSQARAAHLHAVTHEGGESVRSEACIANVIQYAFSYKQVS